MLQLHVEGQEMWDELKEEFTMSPAYDLRLEYSLVSISKWEATWRKPFLTKEPKTLPETRDFIRCMTLNQNVPPTVYLALTNEHIKLVDAYCNAKRTATTIRTYQKYTHSNEIVTSEVIYYWMVMYNIPFECQKWHLSRLMTLIQVCSIKSGEQPKMSRNDIYAQQARLNAQRRARLNTRG